MRLKVVESAARFVEPGETILAAVSVIRGSNVLLRFRPTAMLTSRFRVVAVTGANVYVLAADAMTGTRSKRIEEKNPLGSVEVRFEPGLEKVVTPGPAILGLIGSGATQVTRPPGRLHIEHQKFWVRARDANDAWAVANAATQ